MFFLSKKKKKWKENKLKSKYNQIEWEFIDLPRPIVSINCTFVIESLDFNDNF